MIETSDLLVFTKVVELESLTRVASGMGVPKSTISRKLTALEEKLGAKLLHRTTRGVTATEQGLVFFEYAARCLGVLRDGANAVQTEHSRPRGVLRIALPGAFDPGLLAPLLAEYCAAYPDVRLVTVTANAPIDHFRDGFDLAIVADTLPLAAASLITTRLGAIPVGLYAAPTYLERHGEPQSHVDLARFDLLASGTVDTRAQWRISDGDTQAVVEFHPRLVASELELLRASAVAGIGIAALPDYLCRADLAGGRLVPVLSPWRPPEISFFAVFPYQPAMPVRVRAFLDLLVERLRPSLGSKPDWNAGVTETILVSGKARGGSDGNPS